jgi:hypothetical protein
MFLIAATSDVFLADHNGLDGSVIFDYTNLWLWYSNENIATASGKVNPMLGGLDWTGCIDWDDESPLGHGSFGDVYKGVWKPLEAFDASPPEIVVKVMRPQMDGDEREKAQRIKASQIERGNLLPCLTSHTRNSERK